MDVKIPGGCGVSLGATRNELGGSEYYDRFGCIGLNVPKVNTEEVIPLYRALSTAIQEELLASAHGIYGGAFRGSPRLSGGGWLLGLNGQPDGACGRRPDQ